MEATTVTCESPSAGRVEGHLKVLEERVFQVKTRWPHFRLLLSDIRELGETLPEGCDVVGLERTMLYGGVSLLAPLFPRHRYVAVDCSPVSADARGAYNAQMVDDPRFVRIPYSTRGSELDTGMDDASADLVLVPNLVHHVADQDRLFAEMARVVRPGGQAFVFEPLVRELHQIPDDYVRYTPYGMGDILRRHGFEVERVRNEGGPFQVIAYCWEQALQYLPEADRRHRSEWFWNEHFPELIALDGRHRENLVRKHTAFPMAFSVLARRHA
jgi:SAM-dependent methyltransferase